MHQLVKLFVVSAACLCSLQAQVSIAVVNSASFLAKFPVAPGSLASAFPVGGNFAGVTQSIPVPPFPTQLNGVEVLINGVAAPLVFTDPTQINFQVRFATPSGPVPIRVTLNGQELATGVMDVLDVGPGIFVLDLLDVNKPGAILNEDNTVNSQAIAATRDSVIQVFATGQGPALDGAVEDGNFPPAGSLVRTTAPVKAYVSVDEAEVQFSGLAPTLPGVWQINIKIPNRPYIAGQVPLFVTINGISSNPVSLWVAP